MDSHDGYLFCGLFFDNTEVTETMYGIKLDGENAISQAGKDVHNLKRFSFIL